MIKKVFILLIFLTSTVFAGRNSGYFIQNMGQWPENVKYYAATKSGEVWVLDDSIKFDFYKYSDNISEKGFPEKRTGHIVNLSFINSNDYSIKPMHSLDSYSNYIRGGFHSQTAYHFSELLLENVFDEIDLRLYFEQARLRYDFIVDVGGNPDNISFEYNGADGVITSKLNELTLLTTLGKIKNSSLHTYQKINGTIQEIPSSFKLSEENKISFEIGQYDENKSLIIDPVIFSTYIGGESYDYVRAVDVDSEGNIFLVGYTSSEQFPTTVGAYQEDLTVSSMGFPDVFVSKFSPDGKYLLFSTYIGGFGDDYGEGIVIDDSSNIFVTGYTLMMSTFPVTSGAYDTTSNGGYDVFLLKLDSTGSDLKYSTLIGGSKDDYAQDIAIDSDGNAYVTGYTFNTGDYPVTQGAVQSQLQGNNDCFVSKISQDGSQLIYSTYLGGARDDFGQSIVVDESGLAYVVGITRSDNFPITDNAYDRTYNDTTYDNYLCDAFISKLSANGTDLVYSSFLGAVGKDAGYDIVLDKNRNIIVTGVTESYQFPTTPGAFDRSFNATEDSKGNGDIFITKFNSTGSYIKYSSFFGGAGNDVGYGIALDEKDNIFITGTTHSPNFPVTPAGFDLVYNDTNSTSDGYLLMMSDDVSKLIYSTYFGGIDSDVANGIAYYDETAYIGGWTSSDDFPISEDAFDANFYSGSQADGFGMRIKPDLIYLNVGSDEDICKGDSVLIGEYAYGGIGDVSYTWSPDNGLRNPNMPRTWASPESSTTYTLIAEDEDGNMKTDDVIVFVNSTPFAEIFGPDSVGPGSSQTYSTSFDEFASYTWSVKRGSILSGQFTEEIIVDWEDITDVGFVDLFMEYSNGCNDSTSKKVIIGKVIVPEVSVVGSGDTEFCEGDSVIFDAGAGWSSYKWSDGTTTRYDTVFAAGTYYVEVTDANGNSGVSDPIDVNVYPTPNPSIIGQMVVIIGTTEKYHTEEYENYTYDWQVTGGDILAGQNTHEITVQWTDSTEGNLQVTVSNSIGCSGSAEAGGITIGETLNPKIRALGPTDICFGDSVILDAGYGFTGYHWSDGNRYRYDTIKTKGWYWVAVSDETGFAGISDTVPVNVRPSPTKPKIRWVGDKIRCLQNNMIYQWYLNDAPILGAKEQVYTPHEPGVYRVSVEGSNGCKSYSDTVHYKYTAISEPTNNYIISIYPNPAEEYFQIMVNHESLSALSVELYDMLGRKRYYLQKNQINPIFVHKIDVSKFSPGLYFLKISFDKDILVRKIIVK